MGVSLAGEIQSENVLSRLTYYTPGRGDPKRTKVGISLLPACLYTENRRQVRNKADIMKMGLERRRRRGLRRSGWSSDRSVIVRKTEWVYGTDGTK